MMKIHEDIKEIMSYFIPVVIASLLQHDGEDFWLSLLIAFVLVMVLYPIIRYWRKRRAKRRKDRK
ncbi:hypothetical protein H8744_05620 [Oscillospiraceae bacterium N12]|jgi:predicted PurR-regulated permease PerM|uniref:Uncharacterized protein n=1 Tax=Jilunia laotingensis TaxID=2763675 RepID=A0A926F150_9BACT|nr:hypothetical protein [Jilunia laotingensis]MBC8592736.1 hypothetical protein [Jilunia laotingensis]